MSFAGFLRACLSRPDRVDGLGRRLATRRGGSCCLHAAATPCDLRLHLAREHRAGAGILAAVAQAEEEYLEWRERLAAEVPLYDPSLPAEAFACERDVGLSCCCLRCCPSDWAIGAVSREGRS